MRHVAITIAAVGFFTLAFIGWSRGVPVFICGVRALLGAAALYVVIRLAGTMMIRIIADAAVRAHTDKADAGKKRT